MVAPDLPVVRHHRPDEVPDVDERDPDEWAAAEVEHGAGHCEHCGIKGHAGGDCPALTP